MGLRIELKIRKREEGKTEEMEFDSVFKFSKILDESARWRWCNCLDNSVVLLRESYVTTYHITYDTMQGDQNLTNQRPSYE